MWVLLLLYRLLLLCGERMYKAGLHFMGPTAEGRMEIVEVFVEFFLFLESDPTVVDTSGCSCLRCAASDGVVEMIHSFMTEGLVTTQPNKVSPGADGPTSKNHSAGGQKDSASPRAKVFVRSRISIARS